jgi:hypothetical protein
MANGTEHCGEVLGPGAKIGCGDPRRVVLCIVKDAKHAICKKLGNGLRHTGEARQEELDRVHAEGIE